MSPAPASTAVWRRMVACMWQQRANLIPEPEARVDGARAVVTGGNGGIGRAIARGLLQRGARVTIACRDPRRAQDAVDELQQHGEVDAVPCDLADLDSVARCADTLAQRGAWDIVALNAGIWPMKYASTRQGHEIAFGVNVLAHALLTQRLLDRGAVADGGRVIWLTGDIYIMVRQCSEDYRYTGPIGGQFAYCRSKLGDLWMRHAFAERYPQIGWYAAHPGVVSTNLAGDVPVLRSVKDWMMVSPAEGARTALLCATVPDAVPGYFHNTLGRVRLDPRDPGADVVAAEALYARCLELMADFR